MKMKSTKTRSIRKVSLILTVLALCLAMVGVACAATVEPNAATIDVNNLEDRFVWTDITEGNGKITFTLFEYERFPKDAIENLKAGDILVTDGDQVTVESTFKDGDSGDFYVNKDAENQVLLSLDAATGCYMAYGDDDRIPFIKVGEIQDAEISDYTLFLDWHDPDADMPTMLTGADLKKMLQDSEDVGFDFKNTKILFDSYHYPRLIWRYYSVEQ